jgi:O-acetyl-ADP-ribose deacetylase (regulator of RNase III)
LSYGWGSAPAAEFVARAIHGCASVAFPSISTGAFGYPVDDAARVALDATETYLGSPERTNRSLRDVLFVLFDQNTYEAYAAAMASRPKGRT